MNRYAKIVHAVILTMFFVGYALAANPVTLRYADWSLGTEEENNMQRRLVKAYTDANPHVTIEFVDMSGEGGWEAILTSYAAKGELPDVFTANNTPLYIANDWLADLSELAQNDPDWADIPQVLRDTATYSGKIMGLPSAHFLMGYFVNKDLFEAANLDAPQYGFSLEEFEKGAAALTNPAKGILGLAETENVMGWYSSTIDPNLKWFSYDGEKMNYNSSAFKSAVAKAGQLRPYTWAGLTEDQKPNFKATDGWQMFFYGEVGFHWDASWVLSNYKRDLAFGWDFVGIPGGNQALVTDYTVISKTTANLQEAYNFARWMTFAKESYVKQAELAEAMGAVPNLPVSIDETTLGIYKKFVDIPGILAALENMDNSMVESLPKIVPGYIDARWEGKPGIDVGEDKDVNMWFMFNFANDGRYKYEDYAPQLEDFANKIISEASDKVYNR
jgi:ABC-type glycerol-3-phosphate transport system substrate-binding protein